LDNSLLEKKHITTSKESLVVAKLTPPLLERGLAWFQENFTDILRTRNPWWLAHIAHYVRGQHIMQSEILRKLSDFGYQKVLRVRAPGELAVRGGIIDIFPINEQYAVRIEMDGNHIGAIILLSALCNTESATPLKKLIGLHQEPILHIPFEPGMYVVHLDHGIGKFIGFQERELGNDQHTYLIIQYAGDDKLYVPQDVAHKVTPYIGFGTPPLYRLGGNLWEKTKRKAQEDIWKTAHELSRLYAQRSLVQRPPYEPAQGN
jgi:transcription-repair coupling factor (superfamily II helicase)